MSSPIDHIEKGIRNGDWDTVCEGFKNLTGKDLPIPNEVDASEDMQRIHDIASSALGLNLIAETCDDKFDDDFTKGKKTTKKHKTTKKAKKKKKKKVKKTINEDGEDSSIIIDTTKRNVTQKHTGSVQHITNVPDPEEVARNKERAAKSSRNNVVTRQAARKYEVECNECLESFQSDRRSGEVGQKCDKCLGSRKSQFTS